MADDQEIYDEASSATETTTSFNNVRNAFNKKPVPPPLAQPPVIRSNKPPPNIPTRETGSKKNFRPPTSPTGAVQIALTPDILKKTDLKTVQEKRQSAARKLVIPTAFATEENNNDSKKPPVGAKPPVLKKPTVGAKPVTESTSGRIDFRSHLKPVAGKVKGVGQDVSPKLTPVKGDISKNNSDSIDNKKAPPKPWENNVVRKTADFPKPKSLSPPSPRSPPPVIPQRKDSIPDVSTQSKDSKPPPVIPERDSPSSQEVEGQNRDSSSSLQEIKGQNKKYVRKLLPEDQGFPPPKPAHKPPFVKLPAPQHVTLSAHARRLPSIPPVAKSIDAADKSRGVSTRPVSFIPTMTDEELEEFEGGADAPEEEEFYDDIEVAPPPRPGRAAPEPEPPVSRPERTVPEPEVTSSRPARTVPPPPTNIDVYAEEEYDDINVQSSNYKKYQEESVSSDTSSLGSSFKQEENELEQKQKEAKLKKENEKKEREEKKKQERELKKKAEKENKELKKKQKEEKEIKSRFKLTGNEETIQEGTMLETCKGSKTDLGVQEGERVFIIRLDNNPSGKFLAKNAEGKIGYIDGSKVEVDIGTIKRAMKSVKDKGSKETEPAYEEEEIYEEIDI